MFKKIKILTIVVIILLGSLTLTAWYYRLYVPYLWDSVLSPSADTPENAYKGFLGALNDEDVELALKYFIAEARPTYRQLFQDKQAIKETAQPVKNWKLLNKSKCETYQACKERAIFSYTVDLEEDRVDIVNGRNIITRAGHYEYEMVFIKNLLNKWQIKQL